jgi:signal transduction histidine kinase
MSAFRTVGARLSLALLAVVAIALALVYVVVVPSLQSRLIGAKLDDLERAAPRLVSEQKKNPFDPDFYSNAAASTNARVLLMEVLSETPLTVVPREYSLPGRSASAFVNDPITLRSIRNVGLERGTVTRNENRFAEVAAPIGRTGNVLLLSAPLHDALADVHAVQRRLLVAGAVALLVALAIGYGAARVFARRIRRLERAAERIASGRFDEPVADSSADELGELSRAFDRMRVRLAGLDHARREFVANASHELRTPLFSLSGFLELLEDEELDEPTRREFQETMGDQVRRLTKLAEDLLDLSRLDAGRMHVGSESLDLAELAAAAVEEFAGVAKSSQHSLELVANGAAPARGDEQRVLQIVRILVENALVHTPPGTAVRVSVRREDGKAVVVVEDEGPGIAADDRAQLFERFYRGDGTKASGSGLGLAIAWELAELMGGEIALESRPGRTVFAFGLPNDPTPSDLR